MKYKDFFRHVERKIQEQEKSKTQEERLSVLSEKLANRFNISSVEALKMIQEKLSDGPQNVLKEWKQKVKEAPKKRKKSVDSVIERLKDESNAPSVGDKVKIEFDESARGNLTPKQEELNGKKGEVKIRDPFSKGSQRARYTVELFDSEIDEAGLPLTVNNLTPGEVKPFDSNS